MLPSTILKFWDLGGQRGIRSIWHRYYDDCHAVVYVIDAQDRERLSEGWEVFGTSIDAPTLCHNCRRLTVSKEPRHRPVCPSDTRRPAAPAREQAGQPGQSVGRGDS